MTTALCLLAILVFSADAQLFPSILGSIGGGAMRQGVLLSSLYLLFPFTAAAAGYAADRVGKRTVLVWGAAAMGAPFVIAALVPDYWVWAAAVLLFGVGSAVIEGQSSALLSDASPGRERAALNLSQTFYSVGAAGGPFAIAVAYRFAPGMATSTLLWCAGLASFALCLGFLLLRGSHAHAPAADPVRPITLARDPLWRLLCLALFLYVAVEAGTAGWLAAYGHEALGMPESWAPVCIGLFWGGLGVSRAILGVAPVALRDRTVLLGGLGLALVLQIAAFSIRGTVGALVAFVLLGFAMGAVWPTLVSMAGTAYRASSGSAVGMMVAAGGLGASTVQPVIGALAGPGGLGLRWTLISLGALLALDLLVVGRLFRRPLGTSRAPW